MTENKEKLTYHWDTYQYGGGIYIMSMHEQEGPWATLTINLTDYNLYPKENHVFVPIYKMNPMFYEDFLEEFAESVEKHTFGPFNTEYLDVELIPDWRSKMICDCE